MSQATLESSGGTERENSKLAEPAGNLKAPEAGKIQLLFITSASFSGSTLLTFLLAADPKLATVGELKATSMGDIEAYRCSCGAPILACPFWQRLAKRLAERGAAFDLGRFGTHFRFQAADSLADRVVRAEVRGPVFEAARGLALRLLPGAARELRAILERNRLLVEAICELRGTRWFLDGSKQPNRLKYLSESGFWDVKAVHLVRDGRGVAHSRLRRLKHNRPEVKDRRPFVRKAAQAWRDVNASCREALAGLSPGAWVRVRYEDLCLDPQRTLAPVFGLLGERPPELPQDFRSAEHHILGNVMRLREGRIALDEKWRSGLSAEELALFDEVAGDMNREMGYQ